MNDRRVLNETLRYLGAEGTVDNVLVVLASQAIKRVEQVAKMQHCVRRVTCRVTEDGVCLDDHLVPSKQLAQHLQGCEEAFLFAATLGAEVDRLLRRDAVSQPSLALAEQAAAAALVERYCDDVCAALQASLDGVYFRPRFSAGYGDVSLSEQSFMIQALDATKRIGLACTEAFMLTPSKSVTAMIGISGQPSRCYANGCDRCSKTDCSFRRKM